VRKKLIALTMLTEDLFSIICITSQGAMWCQRLFRYPRKLQP
jgi:hypothetical protein